MTADARGPAAPRATGAADRAARGTRWMRRIVWLALLWFAGVLTVGAVALVLKFAMRLAGLTS